MPRAAKVKPEKWSSIKVLYDDNYYSVIAGDYEGKHRLGERWNGGRGDVGFPNQGGNPTWHVVPPFLSAAILLGLERELRTMNGNNNRKYLADVRGELIKPLHWAETWKE